MLFENLIVRLRTVSCSYAFGYKIMLPCLPMFFYDFCFNDNFDGFVGLLINGYRHRGLLWFGWGVGGIHDRVSTGRFVGRQVVSPCRRHGGGDDKRGNQGEVRSHEAFPLLVKINVAKAGLLQGADTAGLLYGHLVALLLGNGILALHQADGLLQLGLLVGHHGLLGPDTRI